MASRIVTTYLPSEFSVEYSHRTSGDLNHKNLTTSHMVAWHMVILDGRRGMHSNFLSVFHRHWLKVHLKSSVKGKPALYY